MNTHRGIVRAFLGLALAVLTMASLSGQASAQNNGRGTAGTNQGRTCAAQGGHATVYIEEQGDGSSVSYVWCEMPDGSGWTCSNTDYGTECSTWLRTPTGPRSTRGIDATVDLASVEIVADPVDPPVDHGGVVATDVVSGTAATVETPANAAGGMAPLNEDGA